MKDTKKLIIILAVAILCAIFTVIAFILGNKEDAINNNSNNPNLNNNSEIRKEFVKVDGYNEFFKVQNTINDNLEITKHFNALEIYTNNDKKTNYYFVKGSITELLMDDITSSYNIVNYMLIVDKITNKYELYNLSNTINDLGEYANNYDVKHINITGNKRLNSGTDNIEVIMSSYIEYFKNLLYFDTKSAYKMLTDNTKKKYNGYSDFESQKLNIYNSISSNIFGHNIEEKDDYTIYRINDNKYKDIIIYEYEIMNFKIEF